MAKLTLIACCMDCPCCAPFEETENHWYCSNGANIFRAFTTVEAEGKLPVDCPLRDGIIVLQADLRLDKEECPK